MPSDLGSKPGSPRGSFRARSEAAARWRYLVTRGTLLTLCLVVSVFYVSTVRGGPHDDAFGRETPVEARPLSLKTQEGTPAPKDTLPASSHAGGSSLSGSQWAARTRVCSSELFCNLGDGLSLCRDEGDVFPFTIDYLRRHVLIAVVTGEHDGYYRVNANLCTWLGHVPADILYFITDNMSTAAALPGTWAEGKPPSDFDTRVFQSRIRTHNYPPGWINAQFRFFDGFRMVLNASLERDEIRWVAVIDDDTFLNLNELVSMLHERDLRELFLSAVPDWDDETAMGDWRTWCGQDLRLLPGHGGGAVRTCASMPRRMRELIASSEALFPNTADLELLLHRISKTNDISSCSGETCKAREAVWNASNALFDELWVREQLMSRRYISRQPFGGVGHFLSRSSAREYLRSYRMKCVNPMKQRGLASDNMLKWCLRGMDVKTSWDARLCFDGGLGQGVDACDEHVKLFMQKAQIISLHLRDLFRMPQETTNKYLTWYYQAIYQRDRTAFNTLYDNVTWKREMNRLMRAEDELSFPTM